MVDGDRGVGGDDNNNNEKWQQEKSTKVNKSLHRSKISKLIIDLNVIE